MMARVDKPPWTAHDPRERQQMIDWAIDRLVALNFVDRTTRRLKRWWVTPDNWNAAKGYRICPATAAPLLPPRSSPQCVAAWTQAGLVPLFPVSTPETD
jgi:hypothetical protein